MNKVIKFGRLLLLQQNMHIRYRLLRTVLIVSLLVFLTLGILTVYGMYCIVDIIGARGHEMGEASAFYTVCVARDNSIDELKELLTVKANHIDDELRHIEENTELLANEMTYIMQNPQFFLPRTLPNARQQTVYYGSAHLFYNSAVEASMTDDIQREIALAGNIADALNARTRYNAIYTDMCYVGSKHGYTLRMELFSKTGDPVSLSPEFMQNYDPRERDWYKLAQKATKPVFTDVYLGTKGVPCITCAMPYYDKYGLAGVVGVDTNLNVFAEEVNNDIGGDDMFNFALNADGQVVFSSRKKGVLSVNQKPTNAISSLEQTNENRFDNGRDHLLSLEDVIKMMTAGERGIKTVSVDGEIYYIAYEPLPSVNWSFGMAVSKKDILDPAQGAYDEVLQKFDQFTSSLNWQFFLLNLLIWSVMAALLYVLFVLCNRISAQFMKPLLVLSNEVRELAAGNLDRKLRVESSDELDELAKAFNIMVDNLKIYMNDLTKATAEQEHIDTELSVATRIQKGFLPREFITRPEFGMYATMHTAKEVGGDFYDFYMVDKSRLMITMADVSGKGIGAALFMMVSKTVMKNFAMTIFEKDDLAGLMENINDRLAENNDAMMFVTTFIGMLELNTGRFVFVNGGHNPPLLYRRDTGNYSYMEVKKNFVIGPMDGLSFKQQELILNPGDRLYLYTDGVTEALNEAEELYGEERLLETLNKPEVSSLDDKELLAAIRASIVEYAGRAEQSDDITMMSVTYNGKK